MKKVVSLLIAALTFSALPAAHADTLIFEAISRDDRTQPIDMNYRFAPRSLSVEIFDSNKAEIVIKVYFALALNPDGLMSYGSAQPLLRVKIMNELETYKGDTGYLWLEAPNNMPYQGSTKINAIGSVYTDPKKGPTGGRTSLANCAPKTWMSAGSSSDWVAFSIDRNCANIADLFWVNAFFDSNIYASSIYLDSKYIPIDPVVANTKSVPRPPKMKEQSVAFVGTISTQNLDSPKVVSTVTSSLSLPVTVSSLTPTICSPSLSGLTVITMLLKSGTCTLEAFAAGNDTTNPSPRVQQSFTVNPKVMIKQDLTWDEPFAVMEGDESFDLFISTSSGLPIKVTSNSPSVCQFYDSSKPSWVTILGSGTCSLSVRVDATDKYFEASGTASFYVEPKPVVAKPSTTTKTPTTTPPKTTKTKPTAPKVFGGSGTTTTNQTFDTKQGTAAVSGVGTKKTTITCKKGSQKKTITAVNPVCEKGWTKVAK